MINVLLEMTQDYIKSTGLISEFKQEWKILDKLKRFDLDKVFDH